LLVEVITAFLLIVVILAQKSKDQGLGMAFGSGMGESLFGSRAGNVLTRMTVTLIIVFTITTVVLGILFSGGREASRSGSVMDTVDMSRQVPAAPVAVPAPSAPLLPEEQPLVATEEVPSAAQTLQVDAEGNLQPVEGASGEAVVPETVVAVEETAAEAGSPAEVEVEAVVVETPAEAPTAPAEVEEAAPQD
jgi:preprotein translocase subunit SecG